MLSIVGLCLLLLWGLAVVTSFTLDGFIHLLLIVAVLLPIVHVIKNRGQRAVQARHANTIGLEKPV